MTRLAFRIAGILALVLCLAAAAPAHAARLVVLDFSGSKVVAKRVRASLVKRLAATDGLSFASKAQYVKRAAAAGVRGKRLNTVAGARKAAAAAKVDGVFRAAVFKKKGRWHARVRFTDAQGKKQLDETFALGKRQVFQKADLDRLAAFAQKQGAKPAAVAEASEPKPKEKGAEKGAPEAKGTSTVENGVEVVRGFEEPKNEASASVAAAVRPVAQSPLVEARLLAGAIRRGYTLEASSSRVGYEMGGFAAATGLEVSAFPFRSADSVLSGLGLEAGLLRGFLSSRYVDADRQSRSLGTPSTHWHADVRWQHRFLPASARGPSLGARLGWGGSSFDPGDAPALAGVSHSGLRVGLDASQPLLPPFARLELTATLSPLAWPGSAQEELLGSGSSFGWSARAALAGSLRSDGAGLVYGLWLDVTRFSDSLGEDGEASERWLSWGVRAGWAL